MQKPSSRDFHNHWKTIINIKNKEKMKLWGSENNLKISLAAYVPVANKKIAMHLPVDLTLVDLGLPMKMSLSSKIQQY